MKKKVNYKVLALSFLAVFFIAYVGSLFSSTVTQSAWYLENKPSFTPPNFVFPLAWSILYFLIALSLYFALVSAREKDRKKVVVIFGVNLILNALWSYLFFGLKNPSLAFFDLIAMLATIVMMIFVVAKVDRKAGWLLVPYLLWVIFAGILNLAFVFILIK